MQKDTRIPLMIGMGFLLILLSAEFAEIMHLNHGTLVYTLDDAYIHMALAEGIRDGHYGVNTIENSAPSSSILWPFIIAPFSSWEYTPLIFNLIAAIATVILFEKIINTSLNLTHKPKKAVIVSVLLIASILEANVVGLVFIGMEHTLQLLTVLAVVLGLIVEEKEDRVAWWFLIAILVAPLIRYENLAVSLATVVYLWVRKYRKEAIFVLAILAILIGGFSVFLRSLGLYWLPTSVLVKLHVAESRGRLSFFFLKWAINFQNPRGTLLGLGLLGLLAFSFFDRQNKKKRQLAKICALAIVLHFIGGNYGGYHRYEIYIWTFMLMVFLHLGGVLLSSPVSEHDGMGHVLKPMLFIGGLVIVTCAPYIWDLLFLPIASNNIYEQHYQMHRFAINYYNKPVAVNDLGYVSYKNNNYVLDLWGLASLEALEYRTGSKVAHGESWLNMLVQSKGVECAMIYESWFKNIPKNWIKIGTLRLGKKDVTPACGEVAFYALNSDAYREVIRPVKDFVRTLPADVDFSFAH